MDLVLFQRHLKNGFCWWGGRGELVSDRIYVVFLFILLHNWTIYYDLDDGFCLFSSPSCVQETRVNILGKPPTPLGVSGTGFPQRLENENGHTRQRNHGT